MPGSTGTHDGEADPDAWPWRCLGCGGTVYVDVELCRDCRTMWWHQDAGGEQNRPAEPPTGFLEWMRRQPASALSLKVSVVAGVELALTALWLELLVSSAWLGGTVPIGV